MWTSYNGYLKWIVWFASTLDIESWVLRTRFNDGGKKIPKLCGRRKMGVIGVIDIHASYTNRATTSLDPSFFHKWNNCQNNTRNPLPPPTASWDIWRYFGSSWGCCTVAPHVSCQNTKIGQVFKHGNNQRNHFPYFHDQCILVKYFWFGNSKPPPLVSGNNYNTIFHHTLFHNSTFPISSLMQNHRCRYFVNTLLNDIFISLRSTIKVVVFA